MSYRIVIIIILSVLALKGTYLWSEVQPASPKNKAVLSNSNAATKQHARKNNHKKNDNARKNTLENTNKRLNNANARAERLSDLADHEAYLGSLADLSDHKADFIYYRLEKPETYETLAKKYQLQLSRIFKYNHNNHNSHSNNTNVASNKYKPSAKKTLGGIGSSKLIRLPLYRVHKVRHGETLTHIARKYALSVKAMKEILIAKRARTSTQTKVQLRARMSKIGLTLYKGEKLQLPIDYASDVWLYSAYLKSQYKRIADLVRLTGTNTRYQFSSELGILVPLGVNDSRSVLAAGADKLAFSVPFHNQQIGITHIKGYELSKENFHPGIYYHIGREQTVYASERGKIVFIGELRGLGLAVVVRHSERFFSFYSGLKTISVNLKETVLKDDPIAVAQQGMFFSLHYEGLPVNPLEFFERL
ncbi:hypothetical protein COTS27_00931 [Spirochaetota bacterium]|nr:hypothetical protein COTS27_00931 [Spirochaetota bacterium]